MQETFIEGWWDRPFSLLTSHNFEASQSAACRFRVTALGRNDDKEGTMVVLRALAVHSTPVNLGDA